MSDFATIDMIRNDDRTFTITVKNSVGVAINITGYTFFFTVKTSKADLDADAKIAKTWTSHSDPTNGITTFTLVPADTVNLSGTYYFDIQYKVVTTGLIYTPLLGFFNVIEDVTLRTSA